MGTYWGGGANYISLFIVVKEEKERGGLLLSAAW